VLDVDKQIDAAVEVWIRNMQRPRVRHHTGDSGLKGIIRDGFITASRGVGGPLGVHVELQPFATTRPYREGKPCPKNDFGIDKDGAYVEIDLPVEATLLVYSCGPRKSGLIVCDVPLTLAGLNSQFVWVRRRFWEFWRTKRE